MHYSKYNRIQCQGEKDNSCPEYANGCQYFIYTKKFNSTSDNYYYCKVNLICQSNKNCFFFNTDKTYVTYNSAERGIKYRSRDDLEHTLIFHSCSKSRYDKGRCNTPSCKKNSDCYSNNCVSGICMINSLNPTYICSLRDDNSKDTVSCRLNHQEHCNSNEECHSNICYNNICVDLQEKLDELNNEEDSNDKGINTLDVQESSFSNMFTITVILAFISFFFICIIGLTICYILFCHSSSIRVPSRHLKISNESETIYIINENNEVIKTKLKMLDSVHSTTSSTTKYRDKKRILTML